MLARAVSLSVLSLGPEAIVFSTSLHTTRVSVAGPWFVRVLLVMSAPKCLQNLHKLLFQSLTHKYKKCGNDTEPSSAHIVVFVLVRAISNCVVARHRRRSLQTLAAPCWWEPWLRIPSNLVQIVQMSGCQHGSKRHIALHRHLL